MSEKVKSGNIDELVKEWEENINILSGKEVEHAVLKEEYQVLSEKIIADTDFDELYGANNKDVRKRHVKKELSSMADKIQTLEFGIGYLKRRNSFLKAKTYVKLNENGGFMGE